MRISPAQLTVLLKPLNPSRVSTRAGSGGSGRLSYLEAWDVKASLIRVFGFGGFSADVIQSSILRMEKDIPAYTGGRDNRTRKMDADGNPDFNWSIMAQATVRLTLHDPDLDHDATYTETAISSQVGPDIGEVADFAVKTAESDALKRAAIYLGTQFGLSLYDDGKTTDIIKVTFAPGQTDDVVQEYKQHPSGAADKGDPVDQAREFIERATSGTAAQAQA